MTKDCDVPLGLFRIKGLVAYSPNILHLLVYRWNNLSTNHNRVVVSNIFYFFMFIPIWGKIPILTSIFFKGVETTNQHYNPGFLHWSSRIFVEDFTMTQPFPFAWIKKKATTCTALKWRVRNGALEKKGRVVGWSTTLLGQWLNFRPFGITLHYIFSRENLPFKLLFPGPGRLSEQPFGIQILVSFVMTNGGFWGLGWFSARNPITFWEVVMEPKYFAKEVIGHPIQSSLENMTGFQGLKGG